MPASPTHLIAPALFDIDAAIVDLDGTLVDTLGDFEAALGATLHEWGVPALSREVIGTLVGQGSEHLVRTALAHVGLVAEHKVVLARYLHHYGQVNGQHSDLFPGVAEGLEALRAAGVPMACLTNKPLAMARTLLHDKKIATYFGPVFGGDSFVRKKPDPVPVMETCRALKTSPGRTLMVGDSRNDAQAARAAGCPVVLLTYGYNHGEPVRGVDADAFIDSLSELPALLRRIR